MEFAETIREDEFVNGTSKVISVKGKYIALFKIDNRITALGNSCLHKGRPLAKGKDRKKNTMAFMLLAHGMDGNIISRMERHLLDIMNNNLFLMFLLLILIESSKEDRFSQS